MNAAACLELRASKVDCAGEEQVRLDKSVSIDSSSVEHTFRTYHHCL